MDNILLDGSNTEELNPDFKMLNYNLELSQDDQTKLEALKNQLQVDLKQSANDLHEVRNNTKGAKRDRSESSDSNSSREDNKYHRSGHNVKISSVLVHPNRAIESADNEEKRRAILESQRSDKQVFDRNRRMFGMLMGTLKQFKNEETTRERSTVRRSRVEEKLELAVEEGRVNLGRKEDQMREERQQRKDSIDKEELRQDITERFKNWESNHRQLCSYIQTETKPKIFWLPKQLDSGTEKRLKETRDYFSLCVAERTAKLKKELEELENGTREVKAKGSPNRREFIDEECEDHSDSTCTD